MIRFQQQGKYRFSLQLEYFGICPISGGKFFTIYLLLALLDVLKKSAESKRINSI